jgi:hypothetical protein
MMFVAMIAKLAATGTIPVHDFKRLIGSRLKEDFFHL